MTEVHELKIFPSYFEQVITGNKTFEVRKCDRNYEVADYLFLREWDYRKQKYTGRSCMVIILYTFQHIDYVKEGFVILAIRVLK